MSEQPRISFDAASDRETFSFPDRLPSSLVGDRQANAWKAAFGQVALVLLAVVIVLVWLRFRSTPSSGEVAVREIAHDFALLDANGPPGGEAVTLSRLIANGPVVVIVHNGLHCPVCVERLREIADAIEDFKSAGLQVVAIGPDAVEVARDTLLSYDKFPFPLLSDPHHEVARRYELDTADGTFLHGTFVIDQERRIRFADRSAAPMGGIGRLLDAGIQSRTPTIPNGRSGQGTLLPGRTETKTSPSSAKGVFFADSCDSEVRSAELTTSTRINSLLEAA
jgi:peroxiredoxin